MQETAAYKPGLEGVIAGRSAISRVRADVDKLVYRGYDASELARRALFEETAHLLICGALPTRKELEEFKKAVDASRGIEQPIVDLIRAFPPSMHPMDVLRTGV